MPTKLLVPLMPPLQDSDESIVVDLEAAGRIVGEGDLNFVCPHCRARLLSAMPANVQMTSVFRCPSCREYSRMKPVKERRPTSPSRSPRSGPAKETRET